MKEDNQQRLDEIVLRIREMVGEHEGLHLILGVGFFDETIPEKMKATPEYTSGVAMVAGLVGSAPGLAAIYTALEEQLPPVVRLLAAAKLSKIEHVADAGSFENLADKVASRQWPETINEEEN